MKWPVKLQLIILRHFSLSWKLKGKKDSRLIKKKQKKTTFSSFYTAYES